ncbi:MAG TPA: PD-(D/E)XK nuclease family protein [Microlunatus sp.]
MATVTGRPGGHDVQPDLELDAAGDDLRARLDVISKRFAWDGRGLVINHEPTLTRLTQRTMSASTMHAMDGCTARWAFEKVWPGEQDPFAPSVLGNGGHKVLEKLFELPGRDRTIAAAMTILRQVCNDAMPGDDPLTMAVRDRWMAEVYAAFKGIFDIEDTTRVDVYGRELEVRTTIAGVPFVGFVDRVDTLPSGALSVVDFKTARAIPKNIKVFGDEHGDQQRLYLLAMEQQLGHRPESAWLYYTRLGQAKKVAVAKARVNDTRDKFLVAAEKLALIGDTASMTPAPTALCGWCPLVNVCPSAKADKKADRTDKAVPAEWLPIPTIGAPGHELTVPSPPERLRNDGVEVPGQVVQSTYAAHVEAENTNTEPQGATVTRLKEGQPYIELSDGDLNPNSYASMAATDVVEMAVYALDKAGVPLTKAGVQSLAAMYASVIADVQKPVTGSASMQDGMNSRARFLVKRILRTLPTPVHAATVEEWETWAEAVVKRARLMWTVAYSLWSNGPDDPTKIADEVFAAVSKAKQKQPTTMAARAQQESNQQVEPDSDEEPNAGAKSEPAHQNDVVAADVSKPDTTDDSDEEVGFGDFDL